jgi:hypothetical protein
MNHEYYKKYIKYKNKYIYLKNQIGGEKIPLFKHTMGIDRQSPLISNIINKFFSAETTIKDDIIFIDHTNNDVSMIENTENIDRNILILKILKTQEDEMVSSLSFEYLSRVLNEYQDTNIFISFAPLNVKDFYLPKFMDEYLELNPEEKLTIVFTGREYSSHTFPLNITILNEYLGIIKNKYGSRINIIQVYINFELNLFENYKSRYQNKKINFNFINFLNENYRSDKMNILYIGFNACGLISNIEGIENTNYVLIGCDCIKYKTNQLCFDETNFMKITPENNSMMIEIIGENKISLDLLNDIYKI